MKTGPDKRELRMRRSVYGPVQWSLASPAPGTAARFRRWNLVLIAILVFLVLGVFVAAEAPRTPSDTHASLKENASPVPVQHANSGKSAQPPIHNQSGSGNLSKEVMSGHHSGSALGLRTTEFTPTNAGLARRESLRMNLC